jgi:hypothetical protein
MVAGQSVFKLESSYIETSTAHKLLEDTHEVSIAKTKTNRPVPVQPSGRAFESVRTPHSVLQITLKTSRHQSNIVQTLGQSVFHKESVLRSRQCLGSF